MNHAPSLDEPVDDDLALEQEYAAMLEEKLLESVRLLTFLRRGWDDRKVNDYVSSVRGLIHDARRSDAS